MELVQRLDRRVLVGSDEGVGDALVERIAQDTLGGGTIRRVALDHAIPRLLHVEHRRLEIAGDGDPGSAQSRLGDAHRLGADSLDAECRGEAPRRVDGEHQDTLVVGGGDRHAECRAHRGLADTAAATADDHVERRQPASESGRLLANAPAPLRDTAGLGDAHASLPLSASATARVVVSPVRSTMNGIGTTGIGSLLRSWRI